MAVCPGAGPSSSLSGWAASIGQVLKGVGAVVSIMVDSDSPEALGNNLFYNCRVATYADLLTPAIVSQFAGRLVVIDRGHGDPMNLAHVVDIESGAFTVAAGAERIKEWNSVGRGHVAAYCSRSDWEAVLSACLPVKPYMWIATLDGTLNPDGKWPNIVQFAGEAAIGIHVDVSIVYDEQWVPLNQPANGPALTSVRQDTAALLGMAQSLSKAVAAL